MSIIRRNPALSQYTAVDSVIIAETRPPSAIGGVSGNKLCVIGEFEKGPVDVPTRIGSPVELVEKFGDVGPDGNGAYYKGALSLLGKLSRRFQLYVVRVSNATQASATVDMDDGAGSPVDVLRVTAISPGAWGNSLRAQALAATDGDAGHFDLEIILGTETVERWRNLDLFDYAVNDNLVPLSKYVTATKLAEGDGVPDLTLDALSSGADGTFADADYTGSSSDNRGIRTLYAADWDDIRHVYVAEQATSAINAALLALVQANETKIAYLHDATGDNLTTAESNVATLRSDRVVYSFQTGKVYVAEANANQGGLVTVALNSYAAAATASIDPGQNPAGEQGKPFIQGIRELTGPTYATSDYETMRTKGILGFRRDKDSLTGGFSIVSGITSNLDPALKNIARRTMTDFLQESIARFLTTFQNKKLDLANKKEAQVAITDFLEGLILQGLLPSERDLNEERPIDETRLFPYEVDISTYNTQENEANGIFVIFLRVRIFPTMDFIVLRTEIGERVEVLEQAA